MNKEKLKKGLEWIINGVFAFPFIYLLSVCLYLLVNANRADKPFLLLALLLFGALSLLFVFSFRKVDKNVEDKKFYTMFFVGLGVFILVIGLLTSILFFFDVELLSKLTECLIYSRQLIFIILGFSGFITMFLWAIKRIRFRWVIFFFSLCIFFGMVYEFINSITYEVVDTDAVTIESSGEIK